MTGHQPCQVLEHFQTEQVEVGIILVVLSYALFQLAQILVDVAAELYPVQARHSGTYNYGFGQEPDAEADDPAEDIDFDEMLDRIHKETGLCEKVILAVLKAQADYLDDLWGEEEENGEEENA